MMKDNEGRLRSTQSLSLRRDTRGIQFTLEALLGLIIVMGALSSAAVMVPNPSGGVSEAITQRQMVADAGDFLEIADTTGALKSDGSAHGALLYWNASRQGWVNATRDAPSDIYYTSLAAYSTHPLYPIFQDSLAGRGMGMNLAVQYQNASGSLVSQRIVYQGTPGQNAVEASYSVVLRDDMTPAVPGTSSDGDACTLGEMGANASAGSNGCASSAYFAPDSSPESTNYNVVKVSVTIWKL